MKCKLAFNLFVFVLVYKIAAVLMLRFCCLCIFALYKLSQSFHKFSQVFDFEIIYISFVFELFQVVYKVLCSCGCFSFLGLLCGCQAGCFTLLSVVFGCFRLFPELFQVFAVVQVVAGCFLLLETF